MAKTLWHGALVDMGAVTVTVKHEPKASKYSKPNAPKPPYVVLVVHQGGKEEELAYNCENAACEAFFKGRAGQVVTIQASGRGETASIAQSAGAPAVAAPPPQQPSAAPATAQPPPPAAQPPTSTGKVFDDFRHFVARNRTLSVVALEAMWHTKTEFETAKGQPLPPSLFAPLFNAMLFGASSAGYTASNQGLPLDMKFKVERPSTPQ